MANQGHREPRKASSKYKSKSKAAQGPRGQGLGTPVCGTTATWRRAVGRSVYLLCGGALVCLFVADTVVQVRRHLQGQVTVARTVEQHGTLTLPTVSFCPGKEQTKLQWYRRYGSTRT